MTFNRLPQTSTPFPTLFLDTPDQWQWPAPPLRWVHRPPPGNDAAQPCRIETASGTALNGAMVGFDPAAGRLELRPGPDGRPVSIPFDALRQLVLTDPLQPATPATPAGGAARVPSAEHERRYVLHPPRPLMPLLTGQTVGHVETDVGLYLFAPVAADTALQRIFVPRTAYAGAEFGPTAREVAARLWYSDRQALLAAIERQARMPVRPIGESVLALGLLTPIQLERELARQDPNLPLGEWLVRQGLITATELKTVLAHKMGYPLVDLARFPIDPAAAARLPRTLAVQHRMLPLMIDGERLIVAVDSPSRVAGLGSLSRLANTALVPVLSTPLQVEMALRSDDLWAGRVSDRKAVAGQV